MRYKVRFAAPQGWHIVDTITNQPTNDQGDIPALKARCEQLNCPAGPAAVRAKTAAEMLAERLSDLKLKWEITGGRDRNGELLQPEKQVWRLFDKTRDGRYLCTALPNKRLTQKDGRLAEEPTGDFRYEFYYGFGLEELSPSVLSKSGFSSIEAAMAYAGRIACIWREAGVP